MSCMEMIDADLLNRIRSQKPLIHNITNVVVTAFTANGLLALGASPVMAYAKEEVADMAKLSQALVLNIGTLQTDVVEAMIIAGKSANRHGVPVIFDPVGVGSTPYRLEMAQKILSEVNVSVIRGNAGEISGLTGQTGLTKGVDAQEEETAGLVENAAACAKSFKAVVAMTGKEDLITDGSTHYLVQNGHPLLMKVTGTGCLLSSVLGAFTAVGANHLQAVVTGVAAYGVAGELAAEETGEKGPGSFQTAFLDQLHWVTDKDLQSMARVQKVNP
ncbi:MULTISPECIES: hydroxyethylthiazole kinase [Thermoactinomyces]|jgi:hydroxyethylthiazole kinase|uniref:Hydroxyethylthiazole kinase n=1 Tax=Thermoactinomyces vulgaris TaxID=2026 RepID=A0ABS0QFY8_THEVU|nr:MULTISPECIES: hydroxyethylthiazole kinase [Thermoactinomyces]MBA4551255.1 hydroxyethylthiazole kinase [Thermoactinomyces vulgaris]MBA4595534.1 hydroxyethylthiazole kinase [Thermoactinomyces vulgaris]MBH8583799.1 hydroxyethylthiazole kinase [Thermoactinomyces sp. CICC 10735]MBH8587681.1 hydroxyethylthiazole kinase [Thermoactinomyces vulgaris]MBI0385991.1 hydroxyethylthiazole kinase [Thermoactinomyces sp. CICC 24227]